MTTYTQPYNLPRPEAGDYIANPVDNLRLDLGDLADATNRELGTFYAKVKPAMDSTSPKSVGIPLNTSAAGFRSRTIQLNQRIPFRLPVDAKRVRMHVANYADSEDLPFVSPSLVINKHMYIGQHKLGADHEATGQFVSTPTQVTNDGYVELPDGNEFVYDWMPVNLKANVDYLLSYSFYNPDGGYVMQGLTTTFWNSATGAVDQVDGVTLNKDTNCKLMVWMEVEVANEVPVLGWIGDSHIVSRSSDVSNYDSPAWVHGMANGVIPRMYAIGGSKMVDWTANPTSPRWTRLGTLGRCDAVVIQVQSNDVYEYRSDVDPSGMVNDLKARLAALVPLVRQHISENIYLTTVMPRNSYQTAGFEARLDEWNDYLRTLPHGARGCFDIGAAIADPADKHKLNPVYGLPAEANDVVHLNTAGSSAAGLAVTAKCAVR